MLSSASGGFAAMSLMRYDGTRWTPVATPEILPTIPSQGNFAGRVVMLSAATGGYQAWTLIRYDGAAWASIGTQSLNTYTTGNGVLNISGISTAGDIYISDSHRGLIMIDRTTGVKKRFFFDQGGLHWEAVT